MAQADPRPKPPAGAPDVIPEDVRAELDAESKPVIDPTKVKAPIPEDVKAEQDAQVRAQQIAERDPEARPVALDEDSER